MGGGGGGGGGGGSVVEAEDRRSSLRRDRDKESNTQSHNVNGNTGNSITNISNTKNGRLNNSTCLSNVIFPLLSDVSLKFILFHCSLTIKYYVYYRFNVNTIIRQRIHQL